MLSRDEILSKTKLKTETVNVPEWGGDAIISEMTVDARDEWEQSVRERDMVSKRLVNPRAKLIVATVVDENGSRLFTENDLQAIGKLSANSIDAICLVAQKLNRLLADDLESLKKA